MVLPKVLQIENKVVSVIKPKTKLLKSPIWLSSFFLKKKKISPIKFSRNKKKDDTKKVSINVSNKLINFKKKQYVFDYKINLFLGHLYP